MKLNIHEERRKISKSLLSLANPERAVGEKKYLKSSLKHYGVTVPKIKSVAKQWIKLNPEIPIEEIIKLSTSLWNSDWHEEKFLAIELLCLKSSELKVKHLSLIKKMINEAKTWAFIDNIAVLIVGALIDNDPKTLKLLSKWALSENFWVRRTAILAQILQFRRGKGNFKLFSQIVEPMFNEGKDWSKEERFFIRKAIGWSLRELAKAKPDLVFRFTKKHKSKMSALSFREATRKLPQNLQDKLHKK